MKLIDWKNPCCIDHDSPFRPWLILFNVILATIIAIYSAISTMVAESSIIDGLAIEGSLSNWISILYLLGVNCTVPIANLISERFGFKRVFFIGIVIFGLASLATGLSFNFLTLASGRFLEGVGGGIIFPVGMAFIINNFPKEKLGIAINIYMGFGFGAGIAIGAYVGGVIAMWSVWPNLFFVMVPICIINVIVVWLFFDETETSGKMHFDYGGYISFITFICALVIALQTGNLSSTDYGWRSPMILGCFFVSGLALILFVIFEMHAKRPVIPLALFQYPLFVIGCLTLFSLGMSLFATISFMSNYMEQGLLYDKYQSGCALIAYGVSMGVFSIVASLLLQKIDASFLVLIGLGFVIYSYFLNNMLSIQGGHFRIGLILSLRSMGLALALGPVTVHSLKNIPKELTSSAATLLTFFRQVGGTYGGAILGIIVIRRNIFHTAHWGEQTNPWLVGFKETSRRLVNHIYNGVQGNISEAKERATEIIIAEIKRQSYIQAINDAMIMFGYATIAIAVILMILSAYTHIKQKKKSNEITNS